MWPKKSKKQDRTFPFPGTPQALNGHAALYAIESMASDVIVLHAVPDFAEITGPLRKLAPGASERQLNDRLMICQEDQLEALIARTSAYALSGLRSVAMTSSLRGMHEALSAIAGKRLACVINLTCRAMQRQSTPLHGGHDDYHAASAAGLVQLFARNVQEVVDFSLIAHRIAELSLTPVICAQDFYDTSHSMQNVCMPERQLIIDYLGRSEDSISSPTPSQVLLYGEQRRRIPVLVDRDHPAGIGGTQDRDSYFRAVAAQRAYFYDHCDALADQAISEFGELSGRFYNKVSGYRFEDADVLVIAQGAVTDELRASIDYLRKQEKIRAGLVNISMLRPFPGAQLTQMLKGKKAVTVLERTDQPLAEDLPLLQEIRGAIDKALENGSSDRGTPPYPGYETYHQISDRPQLSSAIYGLGCTLPSARELLAVYRNMLAADGGKKCFYLDVNFGRVDRRFPYLQTLQQSLNKNYPQLQQLSLPTFDMPPIPTPGAQAIQIHSLSSQGGLFAGNIFARALANALQWNIRTFPQGGLEQNMQAVTFSLLYKQENGPLPGRPEYFDTILVSAYKLIENLSLLSSINTGGLLIVESNRRPEDMWHSLPRQMQQLIQSREVRLFTIDAQGIAAEMASAPAFIDQLSIWSLLGACLRVTNMLSTTDNALFRSHLRDQLTQLFGVDHKLIDEILRTMDRAGEEMSELPSSGLPWQSWLADKSPVVPEADPPWTAQQLTQWNNNVFDVTRFWHSVGFLYDSGQAEHTLSDPYLATGIIPAGSSAFRDITAYRLRIPEWLAENCSACGLCWAQCPESALPPAALTLSSIIHNAVEECEQQGSTLIQIKRVETHLAKQAYTLLGKDNVNQYASMGVLLQDAFAKLCERMKIEGDKYEELKQEFDLIHAPVQHFRVAKTETFFDVPHKQEKGSGLLLAISLNPMTCTGCGICVKACPDDAFAWANQTTELLQEYQHDWQLQMKLPGIGNDLIDKYVTSTEPQSPLYRLLDKRAYHSMVGGDGSVPGNSAKTAVHLLTATVESVKRPQFQAHIDYLSALIDQLEDKIQGKVTGTLNINDFESFTRRISRLEDKDISTEELFSVIDKDGKGHTVDQAQLQRLTKLLDKLKQQRHLYQKGAGGAGRAPMLLGIDPATACLNGAYPFNPHVHPWVSHLPGDVPLLAEALFEGVMHGLAQEIMNCRLAELELNDAYDSEQHDAMLKGFSWQDFNQQERQLIPAVLVLCQAGKTAWAYISRLLSSPYPIKIAMINSEGISIAEANAGRRGEQARPSHTFMGMQMDLLALEYANTAISQTTVGHPINLIESVVDALQHEGPALLHIYAPDPGSSGSAMAYIIDHAALAYQSRAFPLFRIKRQQSGPSLMIEANPDAENDWSICEVEVREASGLKSSLGVPLTLAHWALRETRFQQHFKVLAKGHLSEQLKPLTEYVDLDPEQREGLQAYIDFADDNQRHMLAVVSEAIVEATAETREFWRYLRKLAGTGSELEVEMPRTTATEPVQEEKSASIDASAYQQVTDRLLQLCGFTQDPEFFKQSLREFITQTEQSSEDE
jgi:pyruvate-ferredoxin/flavodoxin oxidoreductase